MQAAYQNNVPRSLDDGSSKSKKSLRDLPLAVTSPCGSSMRIDAAMTSSVHISTSSIVGLIYFFIILSVYKWFLLVKKSFFGFLFHQHLLYLAVRQLDDVDALLQRLLLCAVHAVDALYCCVAVSHSVDGCCVFAADGEAKLGW